MQQIAPAGLRYAGAADPNTLLDIQVIRAARKRLS